MPRWPTSKKPLHGPTAPLYAPAPQYPVVLEKVVKGRDIKTHLEDCPPAVGRRTFTYEGQDWERIGTTDDGIPRYRNQNR